jgi:hypothetical protein
MSKAELKSDKKTATLISVVGAFFAGLCCFSPLVLFLVGAASASFATELSDTLYGDFKWYFRSAGFLFLVIAYGFWYKKRSVACSLDARKRLRRKMLNYFLLSVILFLFLYVIWLYVIVEYWGIAVGIWEAPECVKVFGKVFGDSVSAKCYDLI